MGKNLTKAHVKKLLDDKRTSEVTKRGLLEIKSGKATKTTIVIFENIKRKSEIQAHILRNLKNKYKLIKAKRKSSR